MNSRRLTGAARIRRAPIALAAARRFKLLRLGVVQPQLSNRGLMDLIGHEAIVLSPYWDSVHVLTIYIGHTRAAGAPDPATLWGHQGTIPEAIATIRADLLRYQRGVDAAFTRTLTQVQKDAAVSFHYNTGEIATAGWVKLFNAGAPTAQVRESFLSWDKPSSIVRRRTDEANLFFGGVYANAAGTAELIEATATGLLNWGTAKEVALTPWMDAHG